MRLRPVRPALVLGLLLAPPGALPTHDWIAEQALMLRPQAEREWLMTVSPVAGYGKTRPER